ncbi:hypothetical protein H8959_021066 [Pygathrix nigripes]
MWEAAVPGPTSGERAEVAAVDGGRGEGVRGEGRAAGGRGGGAWAGAGDRAWGLDCYPGGPRLLADAGRAGTRLTRTSATWAMPLLRPVSYEPPQKTDGPVLTVDDFPCLSKRWDSIRDLSITRL